jgi:hypothetical protein
MLLGQQAGCVTAFRRFLQLEVSVSGREIPNTGDRFFEASQTASGSGWGAAVT